MISTVKKESEMEVPHKVLVVISLISSEWEAADKVAVETSKRKSSQL